VNGTFRQYEWRITKRTAQKRTIAGTQGSVLNYRKAKDNTWYFKNSKARIIGQELGSNGYKGFYEKGLIEEFLNEWHMTEMQGCEAIPDPHGRKF
jgi:hypothetical protein